jgi:hypothetical protein
MPFNPASEAMMTFGKLAMTFLAVAAFGCSGKVSTTDDSTRIEAEGPKLEVGDERPDLDPTTDADVDIDTPAPGDR